MSNPGTTVPGAIETLQALGQVAAKATEQGGVTTGVLELVHLRASQINGCSVCVDMHSRQAKQAGESDERVFGVAAWRETPYFSEAERAALDLAESVTRLSDRSEPVSDDVYDAAAKHFDEPTLAALILAIANVNLWNRLNASTRQVAGAAW